jgi:pilus assembly protein CpaF
MYLRVARKSRGVEMLNVKPGRYWIGSGSDCLVQLDGPGVGSRHARLDLAENGKHGLVDLGSPAGTRVNGERVVTAGSLGERDLISIDEVEIRILQGAVSPGPAALAPIGSAAAATAGEVIAPSTTASPAALLAARRLHDRLISELDLRRQDVASMSDMALREVATLILEPLVEAEAADAGLAAPALLRSVLDEALGLGPLESLLADDDVREIMVNGASTIFVERAGRLERATLSFSGELALRGVVERIVSPLGRRIDDASPMVDARLPDGSRVNVVIPPLAVHGTCVTIRRFGRQRITAEDLVRHGSLDARMLEFLAVCVRDRRNVLVSGGTGSGKTTLLNVLSSLIPARERVITIEDAAELAFRHPNLVSLETRPRNIEGRGEISIRDLVRNALRMRPDRIVVGECRGGETLDMLQAMNTGHDGSLSTVHANSPRELLSRLEVMVLMSGVELPISAIREQIAGSVHIVVHQARFPCGARRITRITEITGVVGDTIQMQDIFRFAATAAPSSENDEVSGGRFIATGHVPQFYEYRARAGGSVDLSLFTPEPGDNAAAA